MQVIRTLISPLSRAIQRRVLRLGLVCVCGWQGCAQSVSGMQLWLCCAQNLWVDQNVDRLEALLRRAAKAGYTHALITDSKFGKLGEMDAHYFRNIDRVKRIAAELRIELVPALFPLGYSNDLL